MRKSRGIHDAFRDRSSVHLDAVEDFTVRIKRTAALSTRCNCRRCKTVTGARRSTMCQFQKWAVRSRGLSEVVCTIEAQALSSFLAFGCREPGSTDRLLTAFAELGVPTAHLSHKEAHIPFT